MNAQTRSKRKGAGAARQRAARAPVAGGPAADAARTATQANPADSSTAQPAARAARARAGITPAERQQMVAEAAYFRAERRGFAAGGELEDWIQAESEIDQLMQSGGSHARRDREPV